MAAEASPPPRSLAHPRTSLAALTQEWSGIVGQTEGQIWEREEGSMLVVWVAGENLNRPARRW